MSEHYSDISYLWSFLSQMYNNYRAKLLGAVD